jgi:hypothetical protein
MAVANCSRVLGFTPPGFADLAGLGTSLHESSSDRLSGGILSVPARLWGKKRSLRAAKLLPVKVSFGSEADVPLLNFDVRFTPESGHR